MSSSSADPVDDGREQLARRLGPFDATMIVMGGIIGAGIFINPSVVARQVASPGMMLLAWTIGGLIALLGAFVYAELAVWRSQVGGQYVYLRDAFHPIVAFLYGWTLLLVSQSGGNAAVAMTFAVYFRELTGLAVPMPMVAVVTLALLAAINCLGVRAGSSVQSTLMVAKIAALLLLVTAGWLGARALGIAPAPGAPSEPAGATGLTAALVPVLFAYGGWQTASFMAGELRNPTRDLPRGLLVGVIGVIALYLLVNAVCLVVLGRDGLASTLTPASDVMRRALGETGARVIALGIAVSTLGFLSQGILTAPRVYFAMARDGLFFRAVGRVSARTGAPVVAILLQGALAAVIALTGGYERILGYVVAIDAIFFALTGGALLIFRAREGRGRERRAVEGQRMPGHPYTTLLFTLTFAALAVTTVLRYPRSAGIGVLILLAGLPAYALWRARARHAQLRTAPAAGSATPE
jgi:APA family basic amino acid/polyamine antiporter